MTEDLAKALSQSTGGRVLLCRHGQTAFNATMRYQGQTDTPLNDLGFKQARALAGRLAEERIDVVYSSDLTRARQTAEAALRERPVDIGLDARLREASFGRWEGLTFAEIEARYPEDLARRRSDPLNYAMPEDGESLMQLAFRVSDFMAEMVRANAGQSMLLVAHGGTINAIISAVLGVPLSAWWRLRNRNAGLTVIDFTADGPRLTSFNDTCHLNGVMRDE